MLNVEYVRCRLRENERFASFNGGVLEKFMENFIMIFFSLFNLVCW